MIVLFIDSEVSEEHEYLQIIIMLQYYCVVYGFWGAGGTTDTSQTLEM